MREVFPALLVACVAVINFSCHAEISDNYGSSKAAGSSASFYSSSLISPIPSSPSKNKAKCADSFVVCDTDSDTECLGRSVVSFLKQTSKGISDCNILSIDPFMPPSIEIIFGGERVAYVNNNVKITGLADQKLVDFKVNTTAKSVELTTMADINMISDVNVYLSALPKVLKGNYDCHATIRGTANYNYDFRKDDKGVEYFVITPKSTTVKVLNTPLVELNPELEAIVLNEANIKAILTPEKKGKFRIKTVSAIAERAYENMIHNVMEAVKCIPVSEFFRKSS